MRDVILFVALAVGILSFGVVLCDFVPRAAGWLRRRRASKGGAFGVVVDRGGAVVGTYLDPFGHPWRSPRIHGADSPWVVAEAGGKAWAWEGFGRTRDEARTAANRLRRRHLQLLGLLQAADGDEEGGSFALPQPYAPPTE
ncbi:MAG TPA: hypothetical protein VE913_04100 [Longimicrobium sp.]|nr:hypothetical protein [Longimicrobium sp.]